MNSCIIFSSYVTVSDGKGVHKTINIVLHSLYMTSSVSDKTKYLGLQINHDP